MGLWAVGEVVELDFRLLGLGSSFMNVVTLFTNGFLFVLRKFFLFTALNN